MTILTAVQRVSMRVIGTSPSVVFSSTDQVTRELLNLAQDVAVDIARSAEWRGLTRIATLSGGASRPVPVDYDRMLTGQGMQHPDGWLWGYEPFESVSDYMAAMNGDFATTAGGGWIILEDEFKFWPATSGTATFPYISSFIARADNGQRRERFESDQDEFVLDERLLELGLMWRYKAQAGLDYGEDMATYGLALAQAQNNDKGARVIRPDSGWPGGNHPYMNRAPH